MRPAYWRGFSKDNLLRGLAAALALASLLTAVVRCLNKRPGFRSILVEVWIYCFIILFLLLTLVHAGMHFLFALLHDLGERAFEQSNFDRAAHYLKPFAWGGNDHYDESGDAHRMLLASLIHLQRDQEAARVAKRCEKLGFESDLEAKD